jgi:hypothetical protein
MRRLPPLLRLVLNVEARILKQHYLPNGWVARVVDRKGQIIDPRALRSSSANRPWLTTWARPRALGSAQNERSGRRASLARPPLVPRLRLEHRRLGSAVDHRRAGTPAVAGTHRLGRSGVDPIHCSRRAWSAVGSRIRSPASRTPLSLPRCAGARRPRWCRSSTVPAA